MINIRIPPLRERRGDIPLLIDSFLQRRGGARRAISEAALDQLAEREWPGNVRQLLHLVENACVMSAADVLDAGDFDLDDVVAPETEESPDGDGAPEELDLRKNLERLERTLVKKAFAKAAGNRALAARLLGIRRQHLYTRMEALGIEDDPKP